MLLSFLKRLFGFHKKAEQKRTLEEEIHLEPKYWQEVRDFIEKLNILIEKHTIQDDTKKEVNQRIVSYILSQINTKGQISDLEERYIALDTIADRIASQSLNKLVGIKNNDFTHPDFSETVHDFKVKLHQRHQDEIKLLAKKLSK